MKIKATKSDLNRFERSASRSREAEVKEPGYVSQGVEQMKNFLGQHPEVYNVFQEVRNHHNVCNEENRLYVFCGGNLPYKQGSMTTAKLAMSIEALVERNETVLDARPLEFSGSQKVDVLELRTADHYRIGYAIPEKNTLHLCDLTHIEEGVAVLGQVIDLCLKEGIIHEIDEAIRTDMKEKKAKKEDKKKTFNIKFGADPEFELVEKGRVVNLCETSRSAFNSTKLGRDGAGAQVEIRPDPGTTPEEFVANIRSIFAEMVPKKTTLSARGDRFPLGGHIHVGFGYEVTPPDSLIKLLDYYIGKPSMKMNGTARGDYGRLSAHRGQPHGFEYRTPSSGTFSNPQMTYLTYKILDLVMKKYIDEEEFTIKEKGSANQADLIALGLTAEEATFYVEYVRSFRSVHSSENVCAAWVPERFSKEAEMAAVPDEPIRVDFSDDWSEEIKAQVKAAIKDLKARDSYRFLLYGLAAKRGRVVAGISVTNFETVGHPNHGDNDETVVVGLPYAFRTGALSPEENSDIIAALVVRARQGISY